MNKKGFKEWLMDEENLTRWKKYIVDALEEKNAVRDFALYYFSLLVCDIIYSYYYYL